MTWVLIATTKNFAKLRNWVQGLQETIVEGAFIAGTSDSLVTCPADRSLDIFGSDYA